MPIRHLKNLFDPHSVAVIGANPREGTLGALVMHNLLGGGFEGPVLPVTPRHESVAGVLSYPNIDALPLTPDLALVCTPAPTIPAIVRDLGDRGTRAAIVLANGLHQPDSDGRGMLRDAMLAEAAANGLRILGPHSLGIMVPRIGLNASGSHVSAAPGAVAFVSQSAAISSSVLDWAKTRGIGFSHFVALGDTADIGFGDVLDYLGSDPYTHAILLFIEGIDHRRTFMSAGRGASRNKPVIVFKAGRVPESLRAAGFHGRPVWGADDVYGAAFRRAGMLRVFRFAELFAAVETLSRAKPLRGDRLAVVANGIGAAMMITDGIVLGGARLAGIGADTAAGLEPIAANGWTRTNPVILAPDAPATAYAEAVKILLADKDAVDAVMVLYAPTALSSPDEAAREVKRPVLTSWMGDHAIGAARQAFAEAGLPTYDTPTMAVDAFLHMVRFRRNQVMLMETPPSTATGFTPATDAARYVVEGVLADDRSFMTEPEAKAVLAAYGIPTVEAHLARTPEEAVEQARAIGFPVALKIHSPDIDHRADIGGVDLFLDTPDAVRAAAEQMLVTVALNAPSAAVEGFTVQKMALRPGALELMIGVTTDPVFGPVIIFGHGGIAADVVHDRAVALPPLNMTLAGDLISRTRISRLLDGYRDRPGADAEALCLTLVQISQLVVDIPEIVELRLNPLFVDAEGVLAVDVRARVARADAGPEPGHPPLSQGVGGRLRPRLRPSGADPADPSRGRAGAPRAGGLTDSGGHPLSLFRPGQRAPPHRDGAAHPDRLRPRDGLHRHRAEGRRLRPGNPRRRAHGHRPQQRGRGVYHPRPLRPQGPAAGPQAPRQDDPLLPRARHEAHRRPGAARQPAHARPGPQPRLHRPRDPRRGRHRGDTGALTTVP